MCAVFEENGWKWEVGQYSILNAMNIGGEGLLSSKDFLYPSSVYDVFLRTTVLSEMLAISSPSFRRTDVGLFVFQKEKLPNAYTVPVLFAN